MAQRVLIAMALVNEPRLLIADEPTTGLDVTVQAQILDLLRDQAHERRLAALIITHDLGIVAQYADRVAVMFAGTIVESGPVTSVFVAPRHPYTRALLDSAPDRSKIGGAIRRAGAPPDLYALPSGCPYVDRCPHAQSACSGPLPHAQAGPDHVVRCHFPLQDA
jgi:peptide/nickel transport system ATP-binding protein/oligopeptide transport system ATP-binding protein